MDLRKKHGLFDHPLYGTWQGMRTRCLNPRNASFVNYGGRGITICERWDDFALFVQDMGDRPDGTTLERIDNDGPYSPENCKWATRAEQASNKRSSVFVTLRGVTKTVTQWSHVLQIPVGTILRRVNSGKTPEQILSKNWLPANIETARAASTARLRSLTHCANGHEFTKENTIIRLNGNRACKECGRDRSREFYRKKHNTKGRQK